MQGKHDEGSMLHCTIKEKKYANIRLKGIRIGMYYIVKVTNFNSHLNSRCLLM